MFLEALSNRVYTSGFYKLIFKFWFYVLFYGMFIPFAFITGLQLHNSCVCWHQNSCESTAIIPTAKMLTAATEIPVAMDVTPSVAEESPTGKNP